MAGKAKPSDPWGHLRQQLDGWDKAALLALVKDLCDRNAANRVFVQARCQAGSGAGELLEQYRDKAAAPFRSDNGLSQAKLKEARQAIRDYRKATGDLPGTAELLMTYLEKGFAFSRGIGDSDERLCDNLGSALDELDRLLRRKIPGGHALFRPRLATLVKKTRNMGWGFGDVVAAVVGDLEADLGQR